MSRFGDDYDEEEFPGQWELYQANLRRALKGRRGQAFLRRMRDALMALPEHRLIGGALCTVGASQRRQALMAAAEREYAEELASVERYKTERPRLAYLSEPRLDLTVVHEFDDHVKREGEGVCAGGAFLWHQKVTEGADPAEAFSSLPLLLGRTDEDGESCDRVTADLLADAAEVAQCVAWEVGSRNDETYWRETPEQRWQAFIDWIDRELTEPATT